MVETHRIIPPSGNNDQEGAQRVFEEFFLLYHPTLTRLESKLYDIVEETEPTYAEAYKPWQKALHELVRGVYLCAKRISLPDINGFKDALRMFSFEGAVQFLNDLTMRCKMSFHPDWTELFREHIKLLLFSLSILIQNKQQKTSPSL